MSACNSQLADLPSQIGYVQCSFCNTILLVGVPCSGLLKVVTVKCGHCTCLLAVSLVRTSFVPLQLLASLGHNQEKHAGNGGEVEDRVRGWDGEDVDFLVKEDSPPPSTIIATNKPPEKRQRAPSAYNRFIKEEIQRIKAKDPTITHKEAFSTAAKNWAHCPRYQHREKAEGCSTRREGKKSREEQSMYQGFQIFMDTDALAS